MKLRERLKVVMCMMLSACICFLAMFCVTRRVGECLSLSDDTTLLAAFSVMPDGEFEMETQPKATKPKSKKLKNETQHDQSKQVKETKSKSDETTYPINELDLSQGGVEYNGFYVNNSTSYHMDIESLLKSPLPFEIDDTRQVQVLIVHTHTCESYMDFDEGYYYESFYPRTTDNSQNVFAVGEAIAKSLKENGIGVVHAKTQHDNPSYDGAYSRSYDTIMQYLEKYNNIKVVLDIHRDSMTQEDSTKLKPTFTYNGKKGAQVMIMAGHDESGESFPFWEDNLNFALKLQNVCGSSYDSMMRPLNFGDFTYNMNVNNGSLLVEVGTDANTLDEAIYSGELLGKALSQVLQNG